MTNTLPYRLSEKAFRAYEHVLNAIVEAYPDVVVCDWQSTGNSINTYRARLADAKASLKQNAWPTTIDMDKFIEHYADIVIGHKGSFVVAGSTMLVKHWKPTPQVVDCPDQQELSNVCRQIECHSLHSITYKNMSDSIIEFVQENFNVQVQRNANIYTIKLANKLV